MQVLRRFVSEVLEYLINALAEFGWWEQVSLMSRFEQVFIGSVVGTGDA